ncbi:MAG: hypothetical protein JNM57_11615 [Cyclobacteriaceae bacterium]|nr:hypothetical protein [Cyclobacteriaceae bacterium]
MKKIFYLFSILLVILQTSCEEESNPEFDENNFTAIFDNNQFSITYNPIDVKQTEDGGYLILGSRKLPTPPSSSPPLYSGIYIMKADKFGNFTSEVDVDAAYVNPISPLAQIDGKYYFFCMQDLTLQTQLVELTGNGEVTTITEVSGITFPTAASYDLDSRLFLLLGYNHVDKQTTFCRVTTSGTIQGAVNEFGIGVGDDNIDEPLLNHFTRTGTKLPFAVGKAGAQFYFNGFYNYTFSLVFFNPSQENPAGVVQGQLDEGGMSAVLPLAGNKFAASRFNFGDNYLLPNVLLSTTGISSSTDLGGYSLPELVSNARVRILSALIDTKKILIYGSDSRSKQIALLFYDESTGTFISSKYLGFSNPFEISSLLQTADGGLVVCGTTYVAGRFPRICLFKISKEELEKNSR